MRSALMILLLCSTPAFAQFAQDDRVEQPTTAAQYWRLINFELNTGKFDTAAFYLKGFLAANPTDEDFIELEKKDGMAAFLRLRNVGTWSAEKAVQDEAKKNADEVIAKVTKALEARLGDQARISKFIVNLHGSKEERAFAISELQRSGARAVPALVAALQADRSAEHQATILHMLPLLPEDSVTPLLAALDMVGDDLKYELLSSLGARKDLAYLAGRAELNPLPTLDYYSIASKEARTRQLARELITRLRPIARSEIRPATWELTEAALRFYRHQEKFLKTEKIPVWRVDGGQLAPTLSSVSQAEEYWGLRAARWALQLEPDSLPAQVAFLSLAVDKAMERAGLEADLAKAAPDVNDLLATSSAATLIAVLDQATVEQRTPVALAVTRVLGQRSDVRATQPTKHRAGPLQRALEYPDRRVQFAAAAALVQTPGPAGLQNQAKIVEILRAVLAAEVPTKTARKPTALIGQYDAALGLQWKQIATEAGYEVVSVRTGHEVTRRLHKANDIDFVMIDADLPYLQLADLLASLRFDRRSKALPVRVVFMPANRAEFESTLMEQKLGRITPQTATLRNDEEYRALEAENKVRRLTEGMRGVSVVRGPLTPSVVQAAFKQPSDSTDGTPLTATERKAFALAAVESLRVASWAGYDLRPADAALRSALAKDDLAKGAIEVVGRLSGTEAQIDLARLVLDDKRPVELRRAATASLIKHMQRYGVVLTQQLADDLAAAAKSERDAELRGIVAAASGVIPGDSKAKGAAMATYQPPKPGEAAPAKPENPPAEPEKPEAKPDGK